MERGDGSSWTLTWGNPMTATRAPARRREHRASPYPVRGSTTGVASTLAMADSTSNCSSQFGTAFRRSTPGTGGDCAPPRGRPTTEGCTSEGTAPQKVTQEEKERTQKR